MIIIVNANIIISSIIKPFGILPKLLFSKSDTIEFVLPEYALGEIVAHQKRICKAAGISTTEFATLLNELLLNVLIYSIKDIDNNTLNKAREIAQKIDENDSVYIAFCLTFDAVLWTGDLKLYRGLRRKGFMNVVITKELSEIIKGLK